MKQYVKHFLVPAVIFAIIISLFPAVRTEAKESVRTARIYSYTGEVHILRGGDKELDVFEGMRLEEGDTLLTGPDASAVIEIDTDKTVTVDANTEITLSTLAGDAAQSQTSVSVFFGNVVNRIKNKLADGSTYETSTSSAVMGVRGTTYLVSQPAGSARVMVTSGTVAVSEIPAAVSDIGPEEIPVPTGNFYQCGIAETGTWQAVTPVGEDQLLELTPETAKALISEEFLQTLPQRTVTSQSVDTLVSTLLQKQEETVKEKRKQAEEKKAELQKKQTEEPKAFFEEKNYHLSGASNTLLTVRTDAESALTDTKDKSNDQAGRTQSAKGREKSDQKTEQANNGKSDSDPMVNLPKQEDTHKQTPPSPDNKNNSSQEDTPPGNQNSGNDQSQNQPSEPDPKPEIKEIKVENLRQDAVYTEDGSGQPSGTVQMLALTWSKSAEADGYTCKLVNNGAEEALPQDAEATLSDTEHRIWIPADNKESLQGMTVRVTPVVSGADKKAVPSEIILDFGMPPSDSVRKLGLVPAEPFKIGVDEAGAGYIRFQQVPSAESYMIRIKENGQSDVMETGTCEAGSGDTAVYTLRQADLTKLLNIEIQAVGDDFNTHSSDWKKFICEFAHDSDGPQDDTSGTLATPQVKIVLEGGILYALSWPPVANADQYIVMAVTGGVERPVNSVLEWTAEHHCLFVLKNSELELCDSLKVKAVSNNADYSDSDWCVITLRTNVQKGPVSNTEVQMPEKSDDKEPGSEGNEPQESEQNETSASEEIIADEETAAEMLQNSDEGKETVPEETE